uniref:SCP domain-containing protein n=1 Tax=Steinernema glaseri TaxID=37863 RepID=A0A1I7ZPD4_9BILA
MLLREKKATSSSMIEQMQKLKLESLKRPFRYQRVDCDLSNWATSSSDEIRKTKELDKYDADPFDARQPNNVTSQPLMISWTVYIPNNAWSVANNWETLQEIQLCGTFPCGSNQGSKLLGDTLVEYGPSISDKLEPLQINAWSVVNNWETLQEVQLCGTFPCGSSQGSKLLGDTVCII